jgi:tetratricopeptide (TPR) repeat protein
MLNRRTALRLGLVAAALVFLAGPARTADDKALREKVLALNLVTGEDPMRGAVLTLVEDKAGTPKLLAVAVQMAQEKDQPLNYNASYILANAAEQLKDYKGAAPLYRLSAELAKKVKSPTRLFESYFGLVSSYYAANKYDDALKACDEFLDIPLEKVLDPLRDEETPKYNDTLRRGQDAMVREKIQILLKQGKAPEARKIVDGMLKKDADDTEALELRAAIQMETNDYAAAARTYEDIIGRFNKGIDGLKALKIEGGDKEEREANKKRRDDLVKQYSKQQRRYRYILSSVYIDAGDVTKATEQLQILLKEEPDNPSYNNDLGYVWADHDMNLAESEKMIRKAIDEDKKEKAKKAPDKKPDEIQANASYLDSLGWVLYKQKKYKEALPPLQEAIKAEDGQSIEIYDHLAEVQMALGEKATALATWKKGVEAWKKGVEDGRTSKREQERKAAVEKKIKANE